MAAGLSLWQSGQQLACYAPTVRQGAISVAFVRSSVHLSVRSSVAYIANNSRTQRPSLPKFGLKVPHLRCDSHTSFKVKLSKVRVTDGRGIPCRPNLAATLPVTARNYSETLHLLIIIR